MKQTCSVTGCDRPIMYAKQCVCQMHYFRYMRNGTYSLLVELRGNRYENEAGYQLVKLPNHPLAYNTGRVFEHRSVLFDAIGPGPMECALCGIGLTWETCCVDHIDCDVRNNRRENLRPTCNQCNIKRGERGPAVTYRHTHKVTFGGETKTPTEWSRDSRVKICGRQIVLRRLSGMSDADALFSPKRTHTGKIAQERKRPYKPIVKYEYAGQVMTINEWSRQPGVSVSGVTIAKRIKRGLSMQEALYMPASDTAVVTRNAKKENAKSLPRGQRESGAA